MKTFYMADLHLGHENIIKHDAKNGGRSFLSIEEHDNLIISNINKTVTLQDRLILAGDLSWYPPAKTAELLEQISCKNLFLVKGNHDRFAKDGRCKKLFQAIYDMKQFEDNGRLVFVSHCPSMMWPGQHRGVIHLYAHLHSTAEETDYQEFVKILDDRIRLRDGDRYNPVRAYNVGCMLWDYMPITLDQMLSK